MVEEKQTLLVSYEQRQDALSNGAIFVRGDFFTGEKSHWEIPVEKEDARLNENALQKYQESVVLEQQKKSQELYLQWKNILDDGCTLFIAKALKDIGVPEDINQRIKMLRILNTVSKDQFYVSWEYLTMYSESFNAVYGWEQYMELAERKNLGKTDYLLEIEQNGLTEEEKAFVRYIFPIGEREQC